MKMVKAENVSYEYTKVVEVKGENTERKLMALENISLDIEKGDFIAVLGHNGSGKYTFAKHLNALLTPSEGTIWVDGMDTKNDELVWNIRQNTGMVFQNPDNQLVATVVEEDIAFGPENLGVEPAEIRQRVDEALQMVGMDGYQKNTPSKLSGGQKQRISIARAIMKDAPVVILDEATANVDPENEKDLMDAIEALTKEKTIIMIAHRLKTVRHADQILVVDKGRIVQKGTHEQLMMQDGIYKRFVDAREQAVSWKLAPCPLAQK